MELEFVRLLQVQRDLYRMPRGMERFRAYLRTMIDAETGDLGLPLVAMNPMGKDHVPRLFGDEAADTLGYPHQGLSRRAGFALALHQALVKLSPAAR